MARHTDKTWTMPPPAAIALIQGIILFWVGLFLTIQEASLPAAEVSWPRLVIYAGMMGGPFAARADTVRQAVKTISGPTPQDEDLT